MHTLEQLRSGELAGLQRLQLRCGLTEFPYEIFDLADSLEILDLSGNQLSALPDDLPRLHKLRVIFCSDNSFTNLPEVLGQCTQLSMVGFKANRIAHVSPKALPPLLRWLILTDNALTDLPAEIGQCTQMQKLALAGNQLKSLPPELANCSRLELIRISANQLTEFPSWLLHMPRLTWLAFAGNPFCEHLESAAMANAPMQHIAWQKLQLQHQLGEGASGVIHQAVLHTDDGEQAVAVKLFKGEVTSDGLPDCEMAACMHAGEHPHLVSAIGRVTEHPQQVQALVMPLIAPEFGNLAGPPSLDTCTRDVYATHARFDWPATLSMAFGIASATQHLHARGILHGDLYAHNILHTTRGDALLSDFGAAAFFDVNHAALAQGLEKLEVRALGCLLEELAAHCNAEQDSARKQEGLAQVTQLAQLAQQCMSDQPTKRPSLAHVCAMLEALREPAT
ncbi:leucine-rich repeat-containing protein kinase family protein [Limnohabitans sp.]|uniref:leucine-rich repeat-containing protein kinase family protein n=1 Tax=Limnohabitans sp. TaxID=1907725 RepID=UPI00286EBE63|nr:leucine-rich repeat-containing protein kinase family protein [Limnohabitans sp.]